MKMPPQSPRISVARLMVLGIVSRHGALHGYRIHRELIAWAAEEWTSIKPGSIYHALDLLTREGLLKASSVEASPSGPQKKLYKLTPSGQAEFFVLLRGAMLSSELKSFAASLAFMYLLPKEEVLGLLRQNLRMQQEMQAYVHALPIKNSIVEPVHNPELVALWVDYHDSCVASLSNIINRIVEGSYEFADNS